MKKCTIKKILSLLIFALLIVPALFSAQILFEEKGEPFTPAVCWERIYHGTFGSRADVLQLKDGFLIATEVKRIDRRHYGDVLLLRLNLQGRRVWYKLLPGKDWDGSYSLAKTKSGYLMAGFTDSKGKGARDAWVVNLDRRGNIIWDKTFGGSFDDYATSIISLKHGSLVTGYTKRQFDRRGFWVARLDKKGKRLWEKFYKKSQYDRAYSIVRGNGGFLLAGRTGSYRNRSIQLYKINGTGKVLWEKKFSKKGSFCSLKTVADGCVVLGSRIIKIKVKSSGYSFSRYKRKTIPVVIKLNSNGKLLWKKEFKDLEVDHRNADLRICKDGSFFISGTSRDLKSGESVFFCAKINQKGKLLWKRNFVRKGDWTVNKGLVLKDGFLLIGRTTISGKGSAGRRRRIWLMKLDKNGKYKK